MSAVAARLASTLDADRTTVGLFGLGLLGAALVGAGVATQPTTAAGGTVLAALLLLGLRFPVLPFAVALGAYVLISSTPGDNALFPGAEEIYQGPAAGISPGVALIAVAGLAAGIAALRASPSERAAAWTPLTAPLLLFLGVGLLTALFVHREGRDGLLALMPTVRLVSVFLIATTLIVTGHLSRTRLLRWSIPAAQVLGAIGIYNASFGDDGGNVLAVSSESGAVLDERTLAFYDAESPFVMVVALAVLLTRVQWGPAAERARAAGLAVLPFVALVLSARRAMWVDLAVAAVLIVLVSARASPRTLVATLAATAVAGVAFVSLVQGSQAYSQRIDALESVVTGRVEEEGLRSRQIETAAVWRNIRAHPVTGIGLTQPYLSHVQFRYQEPTYLHNNYLWVWLKLGLLGVLAMAFLVWRIVHTAARGARPLRRSGQLDDAQATLAAAGVALGFLVAILTASFLTASVRFQTLVGAVLAVLATAPAARSNMRRHGSSGSSELPMR